MEQYNTGPNTHKTRLGLNKDTGHMEVHARHYVDEDFNDHHEMWVEQNQTLFDSPNLKKILSNDTFQR